MTRPESSIISIFSENGIPIGVGFLVADGLALTCAHVLEAIGSSEIDDEFEIGFPFLSGDKKYPARVTSCDRLNDIAEITLRHLPFDAMPVPVASVAEPLGHEFIAFGFPAEHKDGVWATGILIKEISNRWLQIQDTRQSGIRIQEGFSGTPVWDQSVNAVVGMVVAAKRDTAAKMAFCIPSTVLLSLLPNLSIPVCPYRGLNYFEEKHAEVFFGRDDFVSKLMDVVQERSFVPVLGSSGSGKSSVIFAGLVPRLRQNSSWTILDLRPGAYPMEALAAALVNALEPNLTEAEQIRDIGILRETLLEQDRSFSQAIARIQKRNPGCQRILIIIDQFEELYTQITDLAERNRFVDLLLGAMDDQAKNLVLLIALRADFLGHALAYLPLADALQSTDLKLGPMSLDELREAIEKPARAQNVIFEPGLVDLILEHVKKSPDALPLLEFALTQMWERQENRSLTLKAYQDIGGVENALSRYADQVFLNLNQQELEQARRLFTRLVSSGTGIVETRRIAARSDLDETDNALIEIFIKNRLVMTDRTPGGEETLEIVHEALISGSKTLRDWIDMDREFLAWLAQLRGAISQWRENRHQESGLLSGLNLSKAETWLAQRPSDLGREERLFILLSADSKRRADAKQTRLRRLFLTSITVIIAILFAAYFVIKAQRDTARVGQLAAQSELINDVYPQRSVLLALEAMNITSPHLPAAEQALRDGLSMIGGIGLSGHEEIVTALAFSPNNRWLATGSGDTTVRLWDLRNRSFENATVLQGHTAPITTIAFSPDMRWLATASWDSTTQLWDLQRLSSGPLSLSGHDDAIITIAFSPDARWLATGSFDTTILLWDLKARDLFASRKILLGLQHTPSDLTFSSDGHWLAVKDDIDAIRIWDLTSPSTSEATFTLAHPDKSIVSYAFSPDSRWVATGGTDKKVRLWDLGRLSLSHPYQELSGHTEQIQVVSFSPDGRWLATGSLDKTIRLWNVLSDEIQSDFHLLEAKDEVHALKFSPSGGLLATGQLNGTTRLWDLGPLYNDRLAQLNSETFHGNLGSIQGLIFSPNEHWLASISSDNVAWLWNLIADDPSRNPTILRDITGFTLAFSQDGHWLGTTSYSPNVTARLWDLAGDPSAPFNILDDSIGDAGVVVNPKKSWLATNTDKRVRLWQTTDFSAAPDELTAHSARINAMAFNTSGTLLATGGTDNQICLWDIPTVNVSTRPALQECFSHNPGLISKLVFSSNGHWLAAASSDRTVQLKDLNSIVSDNSAQTVQVLPANALITALEFSRDDHWLAVGGANSNSTLQLWNMDDLSKALLLNGHTSAVPELDFSPDGHWLATGSLDGKVILWNLATSVPSLDSSLQAQLASGIDTIQFSPDGRWLAAAGTDTKIYVWDTRSENPLSQTKVVLTGHSGLIRTLAFSPGGRFLATGSGDNTVRLWDLASDDPSRNVIVFRGHKNVIINLSFSSDGHWLISGSLDRSVRYWNMNIKELKEMACRSAGRNFSREEWAQYFPNKKYRKTCPDWPGWRRQ